MHVDCRTAAAEDLFQAFEETAIDRTVLAQERLNLSDRTRTSLLKWRGQFSPELIELLLGTYARSKATVLDPFVGSGTTLSECGRLGMAGVGFDVNPAAVFGARTAELMCLDRTEQRRIFDVAEQLLRIHLGHHGRDLFSDESRVSGSENIADIINAIRRGELDRATETIIVNSLMQCMGDSDRFEPESLLRAFQAYRRTVEKLPLTDMPLRAEERDARATGLEAGEVDLVVTSPPYINVFNYHQNYRKAMELVGHVPLEAAQSEIGANRKHRGNRFYTVVQYCVDMLAAFSEMHRVLSSSGIAIVVVGRESNVRGLSFPNGSALFALAIGTRAFGLIRRHERVFVSRYGTRVYEEILVFKAEPEAPLLQNELARSVGSLMLKRVLDAASGEVRYDVEDALERAWRIPASAVRVPNGVGASADSSRRGSLSRPDARSRA